MRRASRVERLSRTALLAPLGLRALERIAAVSVKRSLGAGHTLWREGSRPDALAVVLAGRLDVVRAAGTGRRMLLRSFGPDKVVGVSTVAGEPCSADVVAGEDAVLLTIPGADVRDLLSAHPELALRAIAYLSELVRKLSDERAQDRVASLDERVRSCLETLAQGLREVRATHQELADRTGATRPNVSRALARLERRGAITCRRGRIEIHDLGRGEGEPGKT